MLTKPSKPYKTLLQDIINSKKDFKIAYEKANANDKNKIISNIRNYLFDQLTLEIFPSWYGTNWDFNGITEKPKEGAIACGYFVTTTLRDLGLNIPRIKWAQAASETMILAATPEVKRFSNKNIIDVKKWLLNQDDAIYIVGLDSHTGFVYKKDTALWSVHSSPFNSVESGVVIEPITAHAPLQVSQYRIFGKLFLDEMILAWLYDKPY